MAAFDKTVAFDPKIASKDQPKVTMQFNKEVVCKGIILPVNVTVEVPLDFAHSFAMHKV